MSSNGGGIVRHPADNLRNVVREKVRIARINAFGRERQQEIVVEFQVFFFEHREQDFVSGSRISCGLENDQMPAAQTFRDLFGRGEDKRDVWFLGLSERRGNADDDRVALAQVVEIGGGAQSLRV